MDVVKTEIMAEITTQKFQVQRQKENQLGKI